MAKLETKSNGLTTEKRLDAQEKKYLYISIEPHFITNQLQ